MSKSYPSVPDSSRSKRVVNVSLSNYSGRCPAARSGPVVTHRGESASGQICVTHLDPFGGIARNRIIPVKSKLMIVILITTELRRFELLTSSMRTRNNAGSHVLTNSGSDLQLLGSSVMRDHGRSHPGHVRSRSKYYSKCYVPLFFGSRAKSDTRQAVRRIEDHMNTESTTGSTREMPFLSTMAAVRRFSPMAR